MFSRCCKLYGFIIYSYGICSLGTLHIKAHGVSTEHLELGLVGAEFNHVLGAEVLGELEKIEEVIDVVAGQDGILCLANRRNCQVFS